MNNTSSLKEYLQLDQHNLKEWINVVSCINTEEHTCINSRHESYKWLAKHIRKIFKEYLDKDNVDIGFYRKGSLIKVKVPVFIGESVRLTSEFIKALVMPVSVCYDNQRIIVFELYPPVKVVEDDENVLSETSEATTDNSLSEEISDDDSLNEGVVSNDRETISSILEAHGGD